MDRPLQGPMTFMAVEQACCMRHQACGMPHALAGQTFAAGMSSTNEPFTRLQPTSLDTVCKAAKQSCDLCL
jgi:hypothetical protein